MCRLSWSRVANESLDVGLLEEQEGQLGIFKIYFKPYASCRHTHSPVEAALLIRDREKIDYREVEKIEVQTYKGVLGKHDHQQISGVASAKMSIPYSVAVAVKEGRAGLCEFTESLVEDEKLQDLTKRVSVTENKELSGLVPERRGAIVILTTRNGETYLQRIDYPKGEPENPFTMIDLESKFAMSARYGGISSERIEEMIFLNSNMENHFSQFMKAIKTL